ncbi:Uncharacterised protein [Mycobacterium tuberculosis]|uniref:hypothetical protein n=1 Tax=Mycobacterium tuberculosis TaxID=1773 RepID=UPI0005E485D0|nr:hypothetical protein [Mycobacterium tuberculosis]CLR16646.1 Uncharacterised protein [Mycobacterium tuberculosis]
MVPVESEQVAAVPAESEQAAAVAVASEQAAVVAVAPERAAVVADQAGVVLVAAEQPGAFSAEWGRGPAQEPGPVEPEQVEKTLPEYKFVVQPLIHRDHRDWDWHR